MNSVCGADCKACAYQDSRACKGCEASSCAPFGEKCFVGEYIKLGGQKAFDEFTAGIIREINDLNIPGMPEIKELFKLCGSYVNLAYPLPSGEEVKLLDDRKIYLACQVESIFDEDNFCFGVVASPDFILVSEYGDGGNDPRLILFKKR